MPERAEIDPVAKAVYDAGCVMFGKFRLAGGILSPFYIDLRRLRSFPDQKKIVVDEYVRMLDCFKKPNGNGYAVDLLADVPTAATPLVSSISDRTGIPQITPRKDKKGHGIQNEIDGVFKPGQNVVMIDDLVTTARSKIEAGQILRGAELLVKNVVVLIDRKQIFSYRPSAQEELAANGYNLIAARTLPELLLCYRDFELITPQQYDQTVEFLSKPFS